MIYPSQRCVACGERLFAHVDGGVVCHNCGARYDQDDSDGRGESSDGPSSPDSGGSRGSETELVVEAVSHIDPPEPTERAHERDDKRNRNATPILLETPSS
ncbi:hypothetical protein ACFQMM_03040 [Saliphagus sp. GCM10025308]